MVGLRKQARCLALHKHRTYILGLLLLYFLLLLVLLFEQLLLQRYIVGWESHGFYSTGRAHFFKRFLFLERFLPTHAPTLNSSSHPYVVFFFSPGKSFNSIRIITHTAKVWRSCNVQECQRSALHCTRVGRWRIAWVSINLVTANSNATTQWIRYIVISFIQ